MDYLYKFRHIYLDGRIGLLVPTGVLQDWNVVGSIPFGGNGHWGIYFSNKLEIEFKEDFSVGYIFRINKRFGRDATMRLPVKGESILFGAEVARVEVEPAPTIIFSPYFLAENFHRGLGVHILYTLRYHGRDSWSILKTSTNLFDADIKPAEALTSWSSDYFTLKVFYDFDKEHIKSSSINSVLYVSWDIPSAMLATKRVYKTNRFNIGLQIGF